REVRPFICSPCQRDYRNHRGIFIRPVIADHKSRADTALQATLSISAKVHKINIASSAFHHIRLLNSAYRTPSRHLAAHTVPPVPGSLSGGSLPPSSVRYDNAHTDNPTCNR